MSEQVKRFCDRCGKEGTRARGLRLALRGKLMWQTENESRNPEAPDLCGDCLDDFCDRVKGWIKND